MAGQSDKHPLAVGESGLGRDGTYAPDGDIVPVGVAGHPLSMWVTAALPGQTASASGLQRLTSAWWR